MATGVRALRRLKGCFFLLACVPLLRWLYLGWTQALSANPPEFLLRSSGIWCLVLLWVTLAITPLRRYLGLSVLIRLRRMSGLFALFYALLHTLAWAWWEHGLLMAALWQDICQRRFVTVGAIALLLMLALGLTSTQGWMRRLGRHWQTLHRCVYLIAVLSMLHFYWLRAAKNNLDLVYGYGAVGLLLLAARLIWWWRSFQR